jgi:hypothetical protein
MKNVNAMSFMGDSIKSDLECEILGGLIFIIFEKIYGNLPCARNFFITR